MISVIMSCHNSNLNFLTCSILSILNQTYTDFEFLIADNDAGFDLKKFLERFEDKRIKFIDNGGNIGAPVSYDNLADLAQGEYIAIQDHDDLSVPHRLEIEKEALDRNKKLQSVSGTINIFGGNREYLDGVAMKPEQVKGELLFWQPIKQPTFMKRKEFCNNYKYNPYYFIYDYEFWSRTREIPHEILPDCLLYYRKSVLNSSKERARKVREEHALITQRNLAQIGVIVPIQTCELIDPYNHKKQNPIFFEHLMKNRTAIFRNMETRTYTFLLDTALKKIAS